MRRPALAIGFLSALVLSGCLLPHAPAEVTEPQLRVASSDSSDSSESSASSKPSFTPSQTLLVFINFSSPYSRQFIAEQLPRLIEDFVTPGTLRLEIIPFAIKKYPLSTQQAINFACASAQGKAFAIAPLLATQPLPLKQPQLTTLDIDVAAFTQCLKSPEGTSWIEANAKRAADHAVTVVPTFILNTETSVGLSEYADLRGWIEQMLDSPFQS